MIATKWQQPIDTHQPTLGHLLNDLSASFASVPIIGLQLDSRKLRTGEVFLAYGGTVVDGRDYIQQAIDAGAAAVLVDHSGKWRLHRKERYGKSSCHPQQVPIIGVPHLRERLSELAGRLYRHPSEDLSLIGITGTNGKTTCSHLTMQLMNALGHSCGVIGTLGHGLDGEIQAGRNTTPDALSIQKWLAQWRDQGIETAVMEVSSHGLDQGRTAGLTFHSALLTNVTQDHLDYHGSMEAYVAAKAKLFQQQGLRFAVFNADDHYANVLSTKISDAVHCLRYSLTDSQADVWIEKPVFAVNGVKTILHTPWGSQKCYSPLLGQFNLSNLVAVITVLASMGFSLDDLIEKISGLHTVPGRMERVKPWADIDVVVDYAHTPDALRQALKAMRLHGDGSLWCVFGCGGERDKDKRAQMGSVAEKLADKVIVTCDNPRSESAQHIVDDILSGFSRSPNGSPFVELDRAKAIAWTIEHAKPGDHVLIAGKGHESYQYIGEQRLAFSDVEHAHWALEGRVQV